VASTQAAHVLFAAVLAAPIGANTARPAAADDYFKGKTIRIIAGSEAGGMYDTFGRLVSRHLADHLPGKPTVVVANMPGASGVRATNYLHEVAPKDGTVLATFKQVDAVLSGDGRRRHSLQGAGVLLDRRLEPDQ